MKENTINSIEFLEKKEILLKKIKQLTFNDIKSYTGYKTNIYADDCTNAIKDLCNYVFFPNT